jgi:hypothetical protein
MKKKPAVSMYHLHPQREIGGSEYMKATYGAFDKAIRFEIV